MPSSLNTSSVVSRSKDRKCKKPCQSSSSSTCCTEQCLDCCSSQYQRLSRLACMVADNQITGEWSVAEENTTRCGDFIPRPNLVNDNSTGGVTGFPTAGAYYNVNPGCSASGNAGAPTPFSDTDGVAIAGYEVANLAYQFVNQFAYGPYEPGCHNDQVYGWYVNVQSGELQLFMQMDGVPTTATRLCLSNDLALGMTSAQKKQLKLLNKLYKLSKSAIKEVNGIPSTEGNIVEVCDCKGEKWLIYIDTAGAQVGSALSPCNFEFSLVACKLC